MWHRVIAWDGWFQQTWPEDVAQSWHVIQACAHMAPIFQQKKSQLRVSLHSNMCRAAHAWRIQCAGDVPGLFCMHRVNSLHSDCCTTTASEGKRRGWHQAVLKLLSSAPACSLGPVHIMPLKSSIFLSH